MKRQRRAARFRLGSAEALEARMMLAADLFISEFSASNDSVLQDGDRETPDWIELHNAGDQAADLAGWRLTDNPDEASKWVFPERSLGPGEFLTVFASGKDTVDRQGNLHTNFSLSSAGEYLALIQPDGTIRTEFTPDYPEQYTDISYGVRMAREETRLVSVDSPAQLLVPQDDRYGSTWRDASFQPGNDWLTSVAGQPVTAAVGFETNSGFADSIATDIDTVMKGANATAYLRIPFSVQDPSEVQELTLNLKYDDGFLAYLNGFILRLDNASFFSTFNSTASAERNNADAVTFASWDISELRDQLVPGQNVLAIQGLNLTAADDDFLLAAELVATIDSIDRSEYGYFMSPTPGQRNGGSFELGPKVFDVTHLPAEPLSGEAVTVTARVTETLDALASVQMVYRIMYADEVTVTMTDDGVAPDAVAGDNVYTALIPPNVASPGEMMRYFIRATDTSDRESRLPRITDTTGTDRSPEYFGTIAQDPSLTTEMPVFHWFAESTSRARSRAGSRVSVYYAGEFYDNVFARQRGGATNGTSQKFNFNDDQPFYVNEKLGRVAEFNMNAQGSDSTFVRQPMAFQTYALAGNESSESFLMLMRDNATRDRVGVFIEQVDEDFLERHGLDPDGALYKFVQRSNLDPVFADTTTGIEKKTRLDEGLDDIREVVNGLTQATQVDRGRSVFDQFNLAQLMNYLALRSITMDADDVRKNFYLYRDTNGTGQWSIFPWDKDWTFGVTGDGGQFLEHPFFGDQAHRKDNALQWNRLYDAVFNDPVLSEMYLRRLRTVMDQLLQPPGTQDGVLEQLAEQIAASAAGEISSNVSSIKSFLVSRRDTLYNRHVKDPNETGEIIDLIPELADAQFFIPSNNDLGNSWTGIADPANIDQWQSGKTGVGFGDNFSALINSQARPNTVCPTCTSIYVRIPFDLADAAAVRHLTLRMKYDDGFIAYLNGQEVAQSNLRGAISFDMGASTRSNRDAVEFANFNISDRLDLLRSGRNVLAIQVVNSSPTSNDQLVLPVLVDGVISNTAAAGIPLAQVGNPAVKFGTVEHNPAGGQDQEYIEIRNDNTVAVDISGWTVTGGVEHTFPAGTVIPSKAAMYITPSVTAFKSRTEGPTGGQRLFVQGNYRGHLSNFGETITLSAGDGTVMDTLTTPVTPSDVQRFLRVSELHYNPAGQDDTTEFIELTNVSGDRTLDLSGTQFSDGPTAPFVIPAGTLLGPRQSLVIASDRDSLLAAYPNLDPQRVIGNFAGRLDNGGERIKIDDALGSTVAEFEYDDDRPWPTEADGTGSSLQRISLEADEDDPRNWRAGTPTPGLFSTVARDLNGDGAVNVADVDFACDGVRQNSAALDLDQNGTVDHHDVLFYVQAVLGTSAGDANLDGVFNSSDMIAVFLVGEYEDGIANNSTWADGDWNCDGEFSSADMVVAFIMGGYVAEARADVATREVAAAMIAESPVNGGDTREWSIAAPTDPIDSAATTRHRPVLSALRVDSKPDWKRQPKSITAVDQVFALDTADDWNEGEADSII